MWTSNWPTPLTTWSYTRSAYDPSRSRQDCQLPSRILRVSLENGRNSWAAVESTPSNAADAHTPMRSQAGLANRCRTVLLSHERQGRQPQNTTEIDRRELQMAKRRIPR